VLLSHGIVIAVFASVLRRFNKLRSLEYLSGPGGLGETNLLSVNVDFVVFEFNYALSNNAGRGTGGRSGTEGVREG